MVLYALIWVYFGINHLLHAKEMGPMVPLPGGTFFVVRTGIAMILAAVAIIFNKYAKPACYLLALMLVILSSPFTYRD